MKVSKALKRQAAGGAELPRRRVWATGSYVSVAVDSFSTLYVADSSSSRIVAVSTALAGSNFCNAHITQ